MSKYEREVWGGGDNELGLPLTMLFVVDADLPLLDCEDQLGPVLVGLPNFKWVKDQRLDHGYGLDQSWEFPVLIGLGPVLVWSFSGLGPVNTRCITSACRQNSIETMF